MTDTSDKKILALDVGDKRTGVAVSDESKTFAFPIKVFEAMKIKPWLEQLMPIIADNEPIESIVVGFPLDQYGEVGRDAQKINSYIAALQERVQIPVIKWDERFSTKQAERSLLEADMSRAKRKQVIDKIAAQVILQSYLDSLKFNSNREDDFDD